MKRSFAVLFATLTVVGCGPKDAPQTQSPPPVAPPVSPTTSAVSPPTTRPATTPTAPAPSGEGVLTLEQALKEVPDVALVPLDFEADGAKLVIQVPKGSKAGEYGRVILPDGLALECRAGGSLVEDKQFWKTGGLIGAAKRYLLDTPEVLFHESEKAGKYHFDATVKTPYLDVHVRNSRGTDGTAVLDSRANCLTALKYARTITLKTAAGDPTAIAEGLGAKMLTDGGGKANGLVFRAACTKSTLGLLAKFPGLKVLRLIDSKVEGADLAALKDAPDLEELVLTGPAITDAALTPVHTLKKLKLVRLTQTKATDAGVKQLQAAVPGAKIEQNK